MDVTYKGSTTRHRHSITRGNNMYMYIYIYIYIYTYTHTHTHTQNIHEDGLGDHAEFTDLCATAGRTVAPAAI